MIASWPSPAGGAEYALSFASGRAQRLLVLPALFDEGNKLRHFTVEVMRALNDQGIDCVLPDLPGCNESLAPLGQQSLASWRQAAGAAAEHFAATHLLSIRAGALCEPAVLPCIRYAPTTGVSLLRIMLRARIISSQEAGRSETRESLLQLGRREGLDLAGYPLGAEMVRELETAELGSAALKVITQAELPGTALWLRPEPASDAAQAGALAKLVARSLV